MTSYPSQTPQDMERETLGNIARLCRNMERYAMAWDFQMLTVNYESLQTQMRCLDIIRKNIRQTPEKQ